MSGLIIQWGQAEAPAFNANTQVTFPVAYSSIPTVVANNRGLSDSDFAYAPMGYMQPNKLGFQVDTNYGSGTKVRINWLAIGY